MRSVIFIVFKILISKNHNWLFSVMCDAKEFYAQKSEISQKPVI